MSPIIYKGNLKHQKPQESRAIKNAVTVIWRFTECTENVCIIFTNGKCVKNGGCQKIIIFKNSRKSSQCKGKEQNLKHSVDMLYNIQPFKIE